jgi:hypothetical protein
MPPPPTTTTSSSSTSNNSRNIIITRNRNNTTSNNSRAIIPLYAVALALIYLLWLANSRQGFVYIEEESSKRALLLSHRKIGIIKNEDTISSTLSNNKLTSPPPTIITTITTTSIISPSQPTNSPIPNNNHNNIQKPIPNCPPNNKPAWSSPFFTSSSPITTETDYNNNNNNVFLTFGIPTIAGSPPRPYLSSTLQALEKQLPIDPLLRGKVVKVVVVHNTKVEGGSSQQHQQQQHALFHQEKQLRIEDLGFDFIEQPNSYPIVPGDPVGTPNFPGERVRQQTRDLANTLVIVYEKYKPQYHVIMEDDFGLCPEGLRVITYLIHRATFNYGQDWLAIRISYGFNGVILQGSDMVPLANYLIKHQSRRPPDHLLVEWFVGEHPESKAYKGRRVHACYKYNILDHLGIHSTLREAAPGKTPQCYQPFTSYDLFEVEVFKPECNMLDVNEDLWPCPPMDHKCPPIGLVVGKWYGRWDGGGSSSSSNTNQLNT